MEGSFPTCSFRKIWIEIKFEKQKIFQKKKKKKNAVKLAWGNDDSECQSSSLVKIFRWRPWVKLSKKSAGNIFHLTD
jgi:hypothetical protein